MQAARCRRCETQFSRGRAAEGQIRYPAGLVRHPLLSYLALCYGISWAVWFAIPVVAGPEWTVMKILVGIGMGPGLAAIVLDRLRGTGARVDGRWWVRFAAVAFAVMVLNVSALLSGDGRMAADFRTAVAPGLAPLGVIGSMLTAAVCGFVFASAAGSASTTLSSIARRRLPLRWCLIALFLPAALLCVSFAVAPLLGEELPEPVTAGLPLLTWAGFALRSLLFTALVVGIGEETGWRGWMLPELQKRFSPLSSSILLGLVWGFWHLPLFLIRLYPGGAESIVEYLFIGPLIAILFTWLFNRTGSLLLAIALHTAINNSSRILPATALFPVLMTIVIVAVVVAERMWRGGRAAANVEPVAA